MIKKIIITAGTRKEEYKNLIIKGKIRTNVLNIQDLRKRKYNKIREKLLKDLLNYSDLKELHIEHINEPNKLINL
jgi:phage pi2 protein 07